MSFRFLFVSPYNAVDTMLNYRPKIGMMSPQPVVFPEPASEPPSGLGLFDYEAEDALLNEIGFGCHRED